MSSISAIGLRGMQQGLELAAKSADQVSRAFRPDSDEDPVSGIIGLKQAENQVKASATLVKADEEMSQAILDILA